MSKSFTVGQRVKNKRTGLLRTIDKVGRKTVHYTTKKGAKNTITIQSMKRWVAGKDS